MKKISLQIKVGDQTKLARTPEARKSLKAMSIDQHRAGAKVTITQKADVGISFIFGHPPFPVGSLPPKEFHLALDHAANCFPNEHQNKK